MLVGSNGNLQPLVYRFLSLAVKTERGSEAPLSCPPLVCVLGSCWVREHRWTPAFAAPTLCDVCVTLLLDVRGLFANILFKVWFILMGSPACEVFPLTNTESFHSITVNVSVIHSSAVFMD